jgi:hypothetical protein
MYSINKDNNFVNAKDTSRSDSLTTPVARSPSSKTSTLRYVLPESVFDEELRDHDSPATTIASSTPINIGKMVKPTAPAPVRFRDCLHEDLDTPGKEGDRPGQATNTQQTSGDKISLQDENTAPSSGDDGEKGSTTSGSKKDTENSVSATGSSNSDTHVTRFDWDKIHGIADTKFQELLYSVFGSLDLINRPHAPKRTLAKCRITQRIDRLVNNQADLQA